MGDIITQAVVIYEGLNTQFLDLYKGVHGELAIRSLEVFNTELVLNIDNLDDILEIAMDSAFFGYEPLCLCESNKETPCEACIKTDAWADKVTWVMTEMIHRVHIPDVFYHDMYRFNVNGKKTDSRWLGGSAFLISCYKDFIIP